MLFAIQLDIALFKKGKKAAGAKAPVKKGKKGQSYMVNDPREGQYDSMITPRNDQSAQNMERVEEDQEEEMAGHDESQQIMAQA